MDVLVLIDKLDDLVHNAKPVPLTDQVRVDKEEIYDILDQMRATIPEEIKQARWIVKERQEMLAEAKRECDRLIGEAREQAVREAAQTEIVKIAERQAQEIVEDARRQARETRRRDERNGVQPRMPCDEGRARRKVQDGERDDREGERAGEPCEEGQNVRGAQWQHLFDAEERSAAADSAQREREQENVRRSILHVSARYTTRVDPCFAGSGVPRGHAGMQISVGSAR